METERLIIRPWQLSDSSDHFEYAQSDLVGPRAGWQPLTSETTSKHFIKWFMTCDYVYAIELKEEKKVIGGIGLNDKCPDANYSSKQQKHIDFDLNPAYWGRGIMPEAVGRLIRFGFEVLNLDLIWCGHYEDNSQSKRVNEKCGFKYHMTKEEVLDQFDNKIVNTLYYKIENRRSQLTHE